MVNAAPGVERDTASDRNAYAAVLILPVLVLTGGLVGFLARGDVALSGAPAALACRRADARRTRG